MQDKKRKIYAKKMRYAGLLLAVIIASGGCTKKEELLLVSEEDVFTDEETNRTEELPVALEENPDMNEGASAASKDRQDEELAEDAIANPGVIYIHVCGAVRQPGVYELQAGSRVYEAVQAAGGFAEGADQNYVNQAQELNDGVKLVIPTSEEADAVREKEISTEAARENDETGNPKSATVQIGIVEDASPAGSEREEPAKDSEGRININTASEAQLCDIPGIGATRAAAIAAYRESHGGFQKPEDIMKVSGIKEGMYEKIKDSISVN